MSGGTLGALISGAVAVIVAVIAALGARSAQKTSAATARHQVVAAQRAEDEQAERLQAQARAEVEARAYERARESYERIVKDLEAQLERNQKTVERVQSQLDLVLGRLATEQDVSNTLRHQLTSLQQQIADLKAENERFRSTIRELEGITSGLRADLRRAAEVGTPGAEIR